MKHLLLAVLGLASALPLLAVDKTIDDFAAQTSAASGDELLIYQVGASSPRTRKITVGNLALTLPTLNASNLTTGTVPAARLPSSLQTIVANSGTLNLGGVSLTLGSLSASGVASASGFAVLGSIDPFAASNYRGSLFLSAQVTDPLETSIGVTLYSDATSHMRWKDVSGFLRTFGGTVTANRTYTLPDVSGTVVTTGDTGTVTSAMLASGTLTALLPSQSGQSGKVLGSNGTAASWVSAGSGNPATTGSFTTTLAQTGNITLTLPSTSATMARTDTGQTFTGSNTFNGSITVVGSLVSNGTLTTFYTPLRFGTDGAFDLGTPSARAGNVYAAAFHGDGSALTGVSGYSPAQFATDSAATPAAGTFTQLTATGVDTLGDGTIAIGHAAEGYSLRIWNQGRIGWVDNADPTAGTMDVVLLRAAADTMAMRRGTNPQAFVLSRTYTDAHNYSQLNTTAAGSTVLFTIVEEGTGVGALTGYSFNRSVNVDGDVAANGLFYGGGFYSGSFYLNAAGSFMQLSSTSYMGWTTGAANAAADTKMLRASPRTVEVAGASGDNADTAIILSSPNGTRYRVTVGNDGTLHTTAL